MNKYDIIVKVAHRKVVVHQKKYPSCLIIFFTLELTYDCSCKNSDVKIFVIPRGVGDPVIRIEDNNLT